MTTTPPATPDAPDAERTELLAALAAARANLIKTTRGLGDEQAGEHPTVSALCLGGLIKHVAATEETWMRFVVEGPSAMQHDLPEGVTWADLASGTAREIPQWIIDHQNEFQMLPGETLAEVIEHYEQVAAHTEKTITDLPDLSATHPLPQAPWHQPEQYAAPAESWYTSSPKPPNTPATRTSCARPSTDRSQPDRRGSHMPGGRAHNG